MLTPEQAAPLVGVPAAQLKRWAWDRVGPKNSGTRWKPKYREEDLREWRERKAVSGGTGGRGRPAPVVELFE